MTEPAPSRLRTIFAALKPDVRDVVVFGGIGLAGYGAGLAYPPAGFIVAGAALFWLGIFGIKDEPAQPAEQR